VRASTGVLDGLQVFPHAGGSASALRGWFAGLDDVAEVSVVEYPGHGRRLAEPPATSIESLVAAALALAQTGDRETATTSLFGHSMGSFVALETVRALSMSGRPPAHLFVSASAAPGGPIDTWGLDLTDSELLTELTGLGGTPRELLQDVKLADMLVKTMRCDLELMQSYLSKPVDRIPQDITVFYGIDDAEVAVVDVERWAELSTGTCTLVPLEGGHFYTPGSREQLVAEIARTLGHA
jgi:surfactin synthase thioesterase subunit